MMRLRFVIGLGCGIFLPLLAGEIYARYAPPAVLNEYLGDFSPLSGDFVSDPVLGASYASYPAFASHYSQRLAELSSSREARPIWLWFGNSFVQAPGMLGDTAQQAMPQIQQFFLKMNEPLNLRAAQLRLLMQHGLRPQRVIFVVLPIDLLKAPQTPIGSLHVTPRGAITFAARLPPAPASTVIDSSRLALLGWVRSGRHYADPSFRPDRMTADVSPFIIDDMTRIFSVLGAEAAQLDVPVTVVLIPNREQLFGTSGYALQDRLTDIAMNRKLDVFDARHVFDAVADKRNIFLPDFHFNAVGNAILFDALRAHFGTSLPEPSR